MEAALEGQGGLEDLIEGTKTLGAFKDGMKPFGEGLNAFISQVKMIQYDPETDGEKMDAIISRSKSLAELQNNLYGTDGWKQAILGVKSLEEFGNDIDPFADGLNGFIEEVAAIKYDPSIDGTKMDAIIGIGESLAKLQSNLYGTEGWKQAILGIKSLVL